MSLHNIVKIFAIRILNVLQEPGFQYDVQNDRRQMKISWRVEFRATIFTLSLGQERNMYVE